jgi:hypothetical protein
MEPPLVDVQEIIHIRAKRYYSGQSQAEGLTLIGDSRQPQVFQQCGGIRAKWIITSPPYYGMHTYIPDQWIRNWFLGGPAEVDYSNVNQLNHGSPESFTKQLRSVWENVASIATPDARMVIRFGGITGRKANPMSILKESFVDSSWVLRTLKPAGSADSGHRQAIHFATNQAAAQAEYDAWAFPRP